MAAMSTKKDVLVPRQQEVPTRFCLGLETSVPYLFIVGAVTRPCDRGYQRGRSWVKEKDEDFC